MALPLYAITLFVSAFILFLVQPIIGKIILPKLGGTPQVWNTCMVFFQMVLLAGYAYTHNASTRLTLRQQLMAHMGLLLLPLIVLVPFPFAFGGLDSGYSIWGFVPPLGSNPIPSTLSILFLYVALPFVVVATTAPLLQKWFAHTGHPAAKDPYFLYGASNFGSMLSLIVYPFLIEPYLTLHGQAWLYAGGYVALIVTVMACACMVWNSKEPAARLKTALETKPEPAPAAPAAPTTTPQTGIQASAPATAGIKPGQPGKLQGKTGPRPATAPEPSVQLASDDVTFGRRFRWVMLAAVPSSLMLGITTHITTDLSPMPLFWLIPLILYLFSFILVFARWPVVWTEQPHTYMVYAQPFFIILMIMVDVWNFTSAPSLIVFAVFAHVLGFFTTTMVCHGELAKDRPGTKHLTEFYLWMSVGGMVGGMFNALVAPMVFPRLYELPLAIFAAGLVRPKMFDTGLFDNWFASLFEGQAEAQPAAVRAGQKGGQKQQPQLHHSGAVVANESLVRTLDFIWPAGIFALTVLLAIALQGAVSGLAENFFKKKSESYIILATMFMWGIPLILCALCMARPLRIGLGIGAVLLIHQYRQYSEDPPKYAGRSYFGIISVREEDRVKFPYRQLTHGHINHGLNYLLPTDKKDWGNVDKDLSRLATTYYHREGPEGRVMEHFNWFPGPPNTYWADARMPTSLVGSIAADFLSNGLPLTEFVTMWSEPPFATVGLGTGTMASYGRPYQHVHFYEIDDKIRGLSLVERTSKIEDFRQYEKFRSESSKITYFNYLERAIQRGSTVQVLMGDARLRMALPYKNHYQDHTDHGGGPEHFYHMMVVDAFSSDAIPAHLLTEQAFELYFDKLTEEGILCVHTSNRFVDLPKVVAAVAQKLKYKALRGHDSNDSHEAGHYTSEWVMVARKNEYLKHLKDDSAFLDAYLAAIENKIKNREDQLYWTIPAADSKYLWTDDYYNLMSVIRLR